MGSWKHSALHAPSEPPGGPYLPHVVSQLAQLHTFHLLPGHGTQLPVAQADVPSYVVGRIRAQGVPQACSCGPWPHPSRHLPDITPCHGHRVTRIKPRWLPFAEHLLRDTI